MQPKIAELAHAEKYAEVQQLTTRLLNTYPDDQRPIKTNALLDKLLATAGSANATPSRNQPTNGAASRQPASNTNAEQLMGFERVDW